MKVLAGAGITDRKSELNGDLRWHDLRHECGSRLAERGVPIHEIQYLMGHAVLITTQRYLNATLDSLRQSVKALDLQVGNQNAGHPAVIQGPLSSRILPKRLHANC